MDRLRNIEAEKAMSRRRLNKKNGLIEEFLPEQGSNGRTLLQGAGLYQIQASK
jgi:hypothetical protein